jgi:hypothetical protein
MHLLICVWCRRYRDQIRLLKTAARQAGAKPESSDSPSHRLPAESRNRIRRALDDRKG